MRITKFANLPSRRKDRPPELWSTTRCQFLLCAVCVHLRDQRSPIWTMAGPTHSRTSEPSNVGRFVAVEEPLVVEQRVKLLSQAWKAKESAPAPVDTALPPPLPEASHANKLVAQLQLIGCNDSSVCNGSAALHEPVASPLRDLGLPSCWESDDFDSDEDMGGSMDAASAASSCSSSSKLDPGDHMCLRLSTIWSLRSMLSMQRATPAAATASRGCTTPPFDWRSL